MRMPESRPANLVVTGFEAFHGVERNPSEELAQRVARFHQTDELIANVATRIFPVVYASAQRQLDSVMREFAPDILLMTGAASGIDALCLERVAKNADRSNTPDNSGEAHPDRRIAEGAPASFISELPLDAYADRLTDTVMPATVSDDAGGFVCNHYYFLGQQMASSRATRATCLFVHVPAHFAALDDSAIDCAAGAILMLAKMVSETLRSAAA